MERKNYHKKNVSSVGVNSVGFNSVRVSTARTRTRKTSNSKSNTSKSKYKADEKALKSRMAKRMSFESPSRKDSRATADEYHCFSLLNYMIYQYKGPKGSSLSKDSFLTKYIIGKGGFGKVYKVYHKRNRQIYAMKYMSKTLIISKDSIKPVLNERDLLESLKHPYMVNMVYAFQDRLNLYLILEYMPGGDLRYQIGRFERFPEHIVKFFVCCILLALQYLHSNGVIHRDIKPENLIFDAKGYLRLTDLGIAMIVNGDNHKDTSGTPGYMAPYVIRRYNHSYPVDFFAVGVIAYECMLGKRPYRGYNRQEIREQMFLFEASVKPQELPPNWSPDSRTFINSALKRKAEERLGSRGIEEVLMHRWLSDVDWRKMISKKFVSPFMPNMNNNNFDTVSESYYDQYMTDKMAQNSLLLRKYEIQNLFRNYYYEEVKMH